MLAENSEIIRYIIAQGKAKGFKFMAITNGYDLDHYFDIITPETFVSLQITLDGTSEIHDMRRKHYITGKSFDKIISNVEQILKAGVHVVIRYNTDKTNFDQLEKLKDMFEEAGFFKYDLTLNSSLVTRPAGKVNNSIDYLSRKKFNVLHSTHTDPQISCQDMGLESRILKAIISGNPVRLNPSFCPATYVTNFIFDPYGDIYSCLDAVGIKKYVIGNYSDGVKFNDKLQDWLQRYTGNLSRCSQCKYALLCGGGCVGQVLAKDDNMFTSICDNFGDTLSMAANRAYDRYLHSND